MELLELALLAVASAFWPILVVVDLVALRTARPIPLLAWFLAGGLLTTISEGLVIVFVLEGTTAGSSRSSVGGWGNIIGGFVALLAAYVLRARAARSDDERPAPQAPVKKASRTERMIESGGPYAFGAGVVLNVFPGIFPLIALRNISALSYGNGAKILLIVGLYLCTFALIEVPLIGLLVAPTRVEPWVRGLNSWLDRNGKRVGIDVLGVVGVVLIVRGLVQLVAT
ncbi:MAG TPA: GAP family protein [Gaiellaceae bacterium]|nr:GAP family protein [Gaiellaceae bacterium]